MPLIKVQTSVSTPQKAEVEAMLLSLSGKLAKHLGKPESYVMTAFEPGISMTFAGTTDPICYVESKRELSCWKNKPLEITSNNSLT